MKRILILLTALVYCTIFQAQNLDKINDADRKKALLRITKDIVMEYGPDYYREYREPEIAHGYVNENARRYFSEDQQKKYKNRSYYTVKYFYNKNEEAFYEDYSALVYIWGNTGEAFNISFGNGFGRIINPKRTKSATKKSTWKKQPPGAFQMTRKVDESELPADRPDRPRYKPEKNKE